MRVPRVFIDQQLSQGSLIEVPEEQARHLVTVLRMREGHQLVVFNGQGGEYDAAIKSIVKKQLVVEVGQFSEITRESPLRLQLGQAISRGERMDFSIQKAVELGVSSIVPISSVRSVVNLDEKRTTKRMQHWNGIIQNACEQSARNHIPFLYESMSVEQWLSHQPQTSLKLIFLPGAHPGLHIYAPYPEKEISVMVGPEGGFDDREIALALDSGYRPVSFGPRILRSETATVAVLTAIQLLWGDLSGEKG